jgi:hypothetical protein
MYSVPGTKLEQLQPSAAARGIVPDAMVVVVSVQWFGSEALELSPRLIASAVLVGGVRDGVGLLMLEEESLAFADSFNQVTGPYRELRGGQLVTLVDAD